MEDIELVIKIPEDEYRWILKSDKTVFADAASKECMLHAIKNGTPIPKGHGKLIAEPTEEEIAKTIGGNNEFADCIREAVNSVFANASTVIEADKKYDVEIVTRGNCMMCGKELTEGLFFCKECEEKAESEEV